MASLRPVLTSALLTLACLAPPGFAVSPSGPDAEAVLGGVTGPQSGRVEGTLNVGAPSRLNLTVDGTPMTLLLEPHSVRAPGFTIELRGKGGKSRFVDPGPVRTVRGTIAEIPGSAVVGIVLPSGLEASLQAPGVPPVWLEPASKKRAGAGAALYSLTPCSALDPFGEKPEGGGCGVPAWSSRGPAPEPPGLRPKAGVANCATLGLCQADLAFDVDSAYYLSIAGGSATVVGNNIQSLMNLVDPRFRDPFHITHRVTGILIRTDPAADPYADPSIDTDDEMLHTMTGEWPRSVHSNDLVHLLTGRSIRGVAGASWTGGVCSYGSFGMVSFTYGGGSGCMRAATIVHELGHSWGSLHTCGMMDLFPPQDCTAPWCGATLTAIPTRRDQVAGICLDLANDPPVARLQVSCSGLACSFDGSASTDDHGIAGYAWSFGDATSGSGTTPSHNYGAGGTYTATLTVTDTNGLTASASRKINLTTASAAPAESYFTVPPCRLFDSRATTILASGVARSIPVSGLCGIPATAKAVSVNLTAVSPTGAGFLRVRPGNNPAFPYFDEPSNLNFEPAIPARANNAVVRLATDGSGSLSAVAAVAGSPGEVHLVVDVTGYFSEDTSAGSGAQGPFGFQTVTPCRLADTRVPAPNPLVAGTPRSFTVQGVCGIPSGAAAAALNLAAIGPSATGFIVAYPSNLPPPGVSNLNFIGGAGIVTANGARIPLHSSTPDLAAVFGSGIGATTHLVLDAQGYFSTSAPLRYHPITPCRAADTRFADLGFPALAAGETRIFPLRGNCGVPASAKAAFVNLVAVGPTGQGFLAAYAAGTTYPGTANLNFDTVQGTIGNGSIVPLGTGSNELAIVAGGTGVHVIVDVFGYFD